MKQNKKNISASKIKAGLTQPLNKKSQANEHVKNLKKKQAYMPFNDHLEELRSKLIRSLIAVFVSSAVCFSLYGLVWRTIMSPLADLVYKGKIQNIHIKLVTSRLQDDFFIQFKVVLMAGILLAIPYILFELWGFVLPALSQLHKKPGTAILIASILLFLSGVLFARFYVWPLVVEFFLFEWIPPPIPASNGLLVHAQKYLSIPEYLSFFMSFHFAFGICFELPVVSSLLALMGILRSSMFFSSWRAATIVISFVAASLTPPDWISMLALMLPLIMLFFISAFFVFLIEKGFVGRRKKSDKRIRKPFFR